MKIIDTRGNVYYFKEDGRTAHREDGPAFELASGEKWYFWEGERLDYWEWLKKVDELHDTIVEIDDKFYKLSLVQEGTPNNKLKICLIH